MVHTLGDAALVFLAGTGTCLASAPLAIRWLSRAQCLQPSRYEDCPPLLTYQATKQGTPTMGGVFVLLVGIVVAAIAGGLSHWDGWLVLGAVVALGAVGLFDDVLKFRGANAAGLRWVPKLVVALAIGALLGMSISSRATSHHVLEIPWLQRAVNLGWAWIPLAMLVTAGCAHAVNLTDGMDGLAAGCVAIALSVLGILVLAGDPRNRVLVPWCASFAGVCVGFLWFNSFPASVFLGDVGALGLGAVVASVSLLGHATLLLLVIGGVFVVEALSVMLQVASYKWRGGQRIFRVAPLHHHFHLGGVSEPKLMARFWIVGILLGALALTTVNLP